MRSVWGMLAAVVLLSGTALGQKAETSGWPEYGGTAAGQRYSTAREIRPENVGKLQVAWTFHTHALEKNVPLKGSAAFESTPVLWNGTLYFDSPFDDVFAVDAETGKLKWKYDPQVTTLKFYVIASRGVELWHASRPEKGVPCGSDAVLVATLDRRLIARDAETGVACPKFGKQGTVDLTQGVEIGNAQLYFFTSPPIVVGETIVVGSSVGDNQRLFAASGAVRGFDAVTGRQKWSWDPVRWTANQHPKMSGSGNVWAPMAADVDRDLVFLPTSSASLDYYGATRVGDNRDADSIVALKASTGERVWGYQLVHHDLWDYDTASQPLLFNFRGKIPAVAVTNKTGMIYVFNRLTGQPLYPIVERPVPQTDVPGEVTWPTQPFSTLPPLVPLTDSVAEIRGNEADVSYCRAQFQKLRYKGLFTPPSEQGTVIYPTFLGGPNWGSSALDPAHNVLYTRVNVLPARMRLIRKPASGAQWVAKEWKQDAPVWLGGSTPEEMWSLTPSSEFHAPDLGLGPVDNSEMEGAPYRMQLQALVTPRGYPCAPGPYGRIVATNLDTGKQVWSVAHGELRPGVPGSGGVGGAIVTAGGLVFAASTNDPYLRGYDAASGKLLWKAQLPATANATPMTFAVHGRQYVVIAVGGHRVGPKDESDTVVAFALPPS